MLFRHIQLYKEQNLEIIQDSDTSDMIQNDFYISYDNSNFDDIVFDEAPICNGIGDKSIMFHSELYISVNLKTNIFFFRSQTDSENMHYKPRSSKFQSFNNFPISFDFPDKDTVYEFRTSLANKSISSQSFNHYHTSR